MTTLPPITETAPEVRKPRVARGEGREALCRALCRVVAREGFDGVTFRSVAAEAGVTHGLASYHFRTREAMIREALSWAGRRAIESSHLEAGADEIDTFAADHPRVIGERPEEAVFQFELLLRALRTPDLLDSVRKSYGDYIESISQSLRNFGIDDDAVARLVFAALDGLTLQQLLYGSEYRTRESLNVLRKLLRAHAETSGSAAAASDHSA